MRQFKEFKFICPTCSCDLEKDFWCSSCGFKGYIKNDLLYLHSTDDSWGKCLIEKDGWINITKERGIYIDNQDHYYLPDGKPHLRDTYNESKKHIDRFLALENLDNKVCLDIGAGIGWVENYILKTYNNAKLIALEVNDDPLMGLGRSTHLKEYFKVDYLSLIADMHNIPLANNSVDIVFSVDAIHHFRDLKSIFRQIKRVLKKNGKFYALNEPDRPEKTDESEYIKQQIVLELKHKIIERRPTVSEYLNCGKNLDLKLLNQEMIGLKKNVDTAGCFIVGQKLDNIKWSTKICRKLIAKERPLMKYFR